METSPEADRAAPGFPTAPWTLHGQLWLSLLRLPEAVDDLRPAGLYGAAFVSYGSGSVLTYSELLVARAVRAGGGPPRASIVDIWVDSPASMAGGRELWAIPKELCDFSLDSARTGPLSRTDWTASTGRRPIAEASFTDVSRAAPRLPLRGGTWQPGLTEGAAPRTAPIRGSAKVLPCRGRWDFTPDGPLAWLREARQVGSFRMADFRMAFG